jgi:hypothetical protein
VSPARAEASRRNGAKSRGPRTEAGKARASQNALKHGLRAAKHVVLPAEDPGAFAALEAALLEELAPEGALQTVLARQIVSAVWRLARVDRMEVELLVFRDRAERDLGLAATRDGNTARTLPALVRYRAAAHAELLRSLRTLEALQARIAKIEPAKAEQAKAGAAPEARPERIAARIGTGAKARRGAPAAPPPVAAGPNEPGRGAGPRLQCILPAPAAPASALHETAASWRSRPDATPRPNEPEPRRVRGAAPTTGERSPAPSAS